MKICIVGSYKWKDEDIKVAKKVIKLIFDVIEKYNDVIIISGECPKGGVDIWAKEEAENREMEYQGFYPKGNSKMFYMQRNKKMALTCDALFRIASRASTTYGSGITMKWAAEQKKPFYNIIVANYINTDEIKKGIRKILDSITERK